MTHRIDLVSGQNCPLPTTSLHVSVSHGQSKPDTTVDVSAFLLNSASPKKPKITNWAEIVVKF